MTEEASNKPRSVELKNEKERKIGSYQIYLNELAQGDSISSEIFTNRGEAHASILMATLLANTTKSLKLYCRGLTPGILCGKDEGDGTGFEGAYWNEFKRFFQETIMSNTFGPNSVEILIQEQKWIYNQPFNIIKKSMLNSSVKGKIKVKQIAYNSKDQIEAYLGRKNGTIMKSGNYNFAIFDGKAFRLEYDTKDYQAIGSFNNPSWCSLLTALFDYAFYNAKEIDLNTIADCHV